MYHRRDLGNKWRSLRTKNRVHSCVFFLSSSPPSKWMLLTSSVLLLLATACLCVIYTESNKNKLINNKSLRNNGWDVSPLKEDDIQHVKLNKHSLYHCSISQLIHYTECCWWKGLRCWLIMASINSVFYKIEPKKEKKRDKKAG